MKPLTLAVVAMAVMSGSAVLAFAQSDPWVGTWKLNVAKSTFDPGPKPSSGTVKLEPQQGGFRSAFDIVDAKGQPNHFGGSEVLDGKDRPTQGANAKPNQTHSFKRIDRGWERTVKENGKAIFTARWVVSADGKTLTVTQKGKNGQGQTVSNVIVHDKQ